ncbi:hypothetical protein [Maribacter ulvicola]|uniref:Uncharacterized protein n=1 Tax=Maribacter ulvicola TaxID=228959 RepID=A0A1N6QFJ6_9FLAO|nr:hypothetical protein [Maribacter ulvicola]SIQ15354.1 hypothetical protein SAMN05421797_101872 [Maribacter ulvicola]
MLTEEKRIEITLKVLRTMVKHPEFKNRVEKNHPKFAKIVEPILSKSNK